MLAVNAAVLTLAQYLYAVQQVVLFLRLLDKEPVAAQLENLRLIAQNLAQPQDVHIIAEIVDPARLSVPPTQRQALQQLLALCRQRVVHRVVVSHFGHLASTRLDFAPLIEELTQLGTSLYMHNVGLETLTDREPNRELLDFFQLLARQARAERAQHGELIREGLEAAAQRGKRLGRPPGSTANRTAYLKKYAPVARLLRQGLSVRKTALLCQVAASTVAKVKSLL